MEDTIETLYSQEEILTYIGFARQFKPQLTVVSKKLNSSFDICKYKLCFYTFLGSF